MPPANLLIEEVGSDSDAVLRDLLGHYLREMAQWFPVAAKADGSYAYDTSPVWERGYGVYLATVGSAPAGFALVGSATEWLGDATTAHDVHEFFVACAFRRTGLGRAMATRLWDDCPGEWLVRVLTANAQAVAFWRVAVADYARGAYEEKECVYKVRPWRYFRFVSGGS